MDTIALLPILLSLMLLLSAGLLPLSSLSFALPADISAVTFPGIMKALSQYLFFPKQDHGNKEYSAIEPNQPLSFLMYFLLLPDLIDWCCSHPLNCISRQEVLLHLC